jgi:hypothetical protein
VRSARAVLYRNLGPDARPYVEKLERDENGGPSAWETTTCVVS